MAAERIGEVMDHPLIIVNKSTVPVGTGDWVADIVRSRQRRPVPFWVVSNPEFLREGSAVYDFMNPDRIVLGSLDREAAEKVAQLHLPLRSTIMITDLRTAEMIKYASNAFLATKISFINEIANICEALGADVKEVAIGMGYDKRIGRAFLDAGVGWGGSCFPKDVKALIHMAVIHGCHPQLLQAVVEINRDQRRRVVWKLKEILEDLQGMVIGLLGLAFKPNTDDIREAPALEIAGLLLQEGAVVRAYDPVAMPNAARVLPQVIMCADPYELAVDADALVVVTDWNEFKHLDLPRVKQLMRRPVIIDGRNICEPEIMRELGFIYRGIGRGYNRIGPDRK
jgi:UDPglucose 6-dehydrogenase